MKWTGLLSLIVLLSGCVIGNGRICGFQTPALHCDKEAYEAALHPKPFVELWDKVGATSEDRVKDWISCGGRKNGGVGFDTVGKILPGESDQSAYERLERNFYSCLIKKGYKYSGCTKEFYKDKPICRG
ncbi:hypothetical protein [Aquitalea pelogenes]|uniref:hypothetical protein n=1 Tax=Aquitalea pelogenes TaxID=1293573 RepID=UPI0035AE1B4A